MPETTSAVALIALNLMNLIHHPITSNKSGIENPAQDGKGQWGFRHSPYLAACNAGDCISRSKTGGENP